jgi:outer membrane lipoprotein SlyB
VQAPAKGYGPQNSYLNATRYHLTKQLLQALLVLVIVASVLACAAQRPVLYPNAHLEAVGTATAQQDIADCLRRATAGPESNQAGKIAGSTAVGGATGAAMGAAAGAVFGSAARGAAAGAAGGATGGLIRGLFHSRDRELTPEQRRLVEQCLREKGYEISGWK